MVTRSPLDFSRCRETNPSPRASPYDRMVQTRTVQVDYSRRDGARGGRLGSYQTLQEERVVLHCEFLLAEFRARPSCSVLVGYCGPVPELYITPLENPAIILPLPLCVVLQRIRRPIISWRRLNTPASAPGPRRSRMTYWCAHGI
jgi:hypothetical protein